MPTLPVIHPVSGEYTSVGIINSILEDPIYDQLNYPKVQATTDSIRAVGQYITSYAPRRNQFISGLINRIGMVRLNYMLFTNPWSWAKQGKLEMGETIEQIWIGLAAVYPYGGLERETDEKRFFRESVPDIMSNFISVNYEEVYPITVNTRQLQAAFLSLEGLKDFIEGVIGSMARAATYDEFMMMKYLLAVLLLDGKIKTREIPLITDTTANVAITAVAETTNLFQFPSTSYTIAGNLNTTPIDDLYILESARANALIKVNSLASAFNVDYVKFIGKVVMYDSLATFDWSRMDKICAKDTTYRRFTEAELAALAQVDIIAMDRKFMQVYDRLEEMGKPFENGETLNENYWLHKWMIFAASPFHNCIAYVTIPSTVTKVEVSGYSKYLAGLAVPFQATVTTAGFANAGVTWTVTPAAGGTIEYGTFIDPSGLLYTDTNQTGTLTVTATSNFDPTKKASATIAQAT